MKTLQILLLFSGIFVVSGMRWPSIGLNSMSFTGYFSRLERIGPGKDVTESDKIRAKALGPNVCVQRIPIGFQTRCIMINLKYNCSMTSQYRSVFHCCPGFTAILRKSGCPHELYVSNKTLIEAAKELGLTTLVTLISKAGLTKTLSGKDKFTLLAPSDLAFKALGKETIKELTKDKKALSKILLYHVINGKVPSSALEDNTLVKTMDEKKAVRVNLYFNRQIVTFNGARAALKNKGASNGIIHVIDAVLTPPSLSAEKILAGLKEASLFRKALAMSNITISKGTTIFAPTNDAFNKMDASVFARLLSSPTCMKNLLRNHILPDAVFSKVLENNQQLGVRTMEGTAYYLKTANGTIKIDKASVIKSDLLATDAVVHVIDSVIIPTSALTVLDIAKRNGANVFARLIKTAGLKSLIKDDKKYTIFAPSDEAMKKFVGNSSAEVLGNIAEIIKYHIVPRSLQTCEFENDMLLDTLDGENKIRINVYNYGKNNAVQGVCLGSSKCNIEACNGAVHVISKVLVPPKQTLQDVIDTDKRFTAFAAALEKAGLQPKLKEKAPLTIFAPTNAAFSKMHPKDLEKLLAESQRLKELLRYHIIHGTYFHCAFSTQCPITTMNGRSVLVHMAKDVINVNDATANGAEIAATNGVIYPIDTVLQMNDKEQTFTNSFWQMFNY